MKGLFQCPPWARSFCPFRACGAKLAKLQLKQKRRVCLGLLTHPHSTLIQHSTLNIQPSFNTQHSTFNTQKYCFCSFCSSYWIKSALFCSIRMKYWIFFVSLPRFNQFIWREMRTIINNQKKERDILLSRPYLTRHTQFEVDERDLFIVTQISQMTQIFT